ncbi:MAG TPA: hypothetical protein VFF68_00570 [Anaerolineaceae bacterium]|nr:hypothetical protein [Anaerolineaceae bacterium]
MNCLPTPFRWAMLVLCLCLGAALPASAAQSVQAHVPETIAISSAIRPETLSTGIYHACAIQSDGTVICWGRDDENQATAPTGTFTQVAAGMYHTCGLKTDGEVACWGEEMFFQQIPAGPFKQISANQTYTCGIEDYGDVVCWGNPMPEPVPGLELIQVDAGSSHACGVKKDGTLTCWGNNTGG